MYGSVTDAPRRVGRHGYHTVRTYKGKGAWISDDTPRYITERVVAYTDADAIAEGLTDMVDEVFTFGLFEEIVADVLEAQEYDYEDWRHQYALRLNWYIDQGFDVTRELSHDESLPSEFTWQEAGFAYSCNHGCKRYTDGFVYIAHHNSNYGCHR